MTGSDSPVLYSEQEVLQNQDTPILLLIVVRTSTSLQIACNQKLNSSPTRTVKLAGAGAGAGGCASRARAPFAFSTLGRLGHFISLRVLVYNGVLLNATVRTETIIATSVVLVL